MVDYVKTLGRQSGSRMMIRDLGQKIEFWVRSGSPYTYHFAMPFGWTVNGSTGSSTVPYNYPYPGWSGSPTTPGPWVRCKTFTVKTTQKVTFRIGSTGTAGLNGPTSFTVKIERNSARVRYNGAYRFATPYVKYNGVWRPAQAWVKHDGKWKVAG